MPEAMMPGASADRIAVIVAAGRGIPTMVNGSKGRCR
jgi:hypothetical protein